MKWMLVVMILLVGACAEYPLHIGIAEKLVVFERTSEYDTECFIARGDAMYEAWNYHSRACVIRLGDSCRIVASPGASDSVLGLLLRHCFDGNY